MPNGNLLSVDAKYTFRYCGKQNGFYAFRAPTWKTTNRNVLDAQQFEGLVAGWFMENANGEWHVSSFKEVEGYQYMPHAFENNKSLCILVESIKDVLAFEQKFNVNYAGQKL